MKRKYKKHTNPNCQCCSCKARRGEYRGKNHPCYKGNPPKHYFCIDCKNEISYTNWLYGGRRCYSCARKGKNNPMFHKFHTQKVKKKISIKAKKRLSIPENNPNYKHGKTLKNYYCTICGKKLSGYRTKICRSCSAKKRLKNPKNHPFYIDGRSFEKYPKEFNNILREQIRKRDNYTCQGEKCLMTQEEHFIMYGRDIEIHHIDHNRKNSKENNLITLCKKCNIQANSNQEYWRKIYVKKRNIL